MKSTKGLVLGIIMFAALLILVFSFPAVGDTAKKFQFALAGFFDRSFDYEHFSQLRLENQRMKFELEQLQQNPSLRKDFQYKNALVYSQYPFNDKKAVTINLGSEEGVVESNPVLTESGFLFGVVSQTRNHQSEVRTIFDPEWSNSVAIGSFRTEAVLQGGSPPQLDLVPIDADVSVGDNIFNTSDNYPLFQLMGTLDSLEEKEGGLWNTGDVNVPYQAENVRSVMVVTDFP